MTKAMLFVDGTWLHHARVPLSEVTSHAEYRIDYGLLPEVLCRKTAVRITAPGLRLVGKLWFGSIPVNVHPLDGEKAERQRAFFGILERLGYCVTLGYVDFKGHRIREEDRDRRDRFTPEEKAVDAALTTELVGRVEAYDVAIVVAGDGDYLPAVRAVISRGKIVVIVTAMGSCNHRLYDVRGVEILRLDDFACELELVEATQEMECQSHLHQGDRRVLGRWRPQNGSPFYCSECRRKFKQPQYPARPASQPGMPAAVGSPVEPWRARFALRSRVMLWHAPVALGGARR
jgi:hypothetical protein